MEPRTERDYTEAILEVVGKDHPSVEPLERVLYYRLLPHEKAGVLATIIFARQWRRGNLQTSEGIEALQRIMERTLSPVPETAPQLENSTPLE